VGKRLILLLAGALILSGVSRGSPVLTGEFRSDYYMYQDALEQDRFIFNQTLHGRLAPKSWNGWNVNFLGELRDANNPVEGIDEGRLLGLSLAGKIGPAALMMGRITPHTPGPSMLDGLEASYPFGGVKLTVAGGQEVYSLRRISTSELPERYRVGGVVEGTIMGKMKWQVDHATRLLSSEVDDQTTGIALRCRRFAKFGWDARLNYDMKASTPREMAFGVRLTPFSNLRVDLRYSVRAIRIYQESFLSQFTLEPTKLALVKARYHLQSQGLWIGLGYTRRLREEGDLDRVSASVSSDHGELGLRYQAGTDLNNIGGWVEANGKLATHLDWAVSVDFDQWDSAWDAETVEAWANSATLSYELSPVALVEGRLEHYRDEVVNSDIRGLITFKIRYGI